MPRLYKTSRTVAEAWAEFKRTKNLTVLDDRDIRRAEYSFYNGAVAMMDLLINMNHPPPNDPTWEAEVSITLDALIAELDLYIEGYMAAGQPRQ